MKSVSKFTASVCDERRAPGRIHDLHVGGILRDFARVLEVHVIDEHGVFHVVALGLEADCGDVGRVEFDFFAPAALCEVLEADEHLRPCARGLHGGEMHVVVFHVGGFHVDFVLAALEPVADAAEAGQIERVGNLHTPAHIRIVGVIALVKIVIDGECVFGAVVRTPGLREAVVVQRSQNDRCTVIVVVVVGVPECLRDKALVVAVLEIVNEEALTGLFRDGRCGRDFGSLFGYREFGYRRQAICRGLDAVARVGRIVGDGVGGDGARIFGRVVRVGCAVGITAGGKPDGEDACCCERNEFLEIHKNLFFFHNISKNVGGCLSEQA